MSRQAKDFRFSILGCNKFDGSAAPQPPPDFLEVCMNRIIKVGQQVVLVAVVAAVTAFVSASVAVKALEAAQPKAKPNMIQLVDYPRPCSTSC
jgi:hypothetical protein